MAFRKLTYFGFELETGVEELVGEFPPALAEQAREALVTALLEGDSPHPAQGRIRRAVQELDELYRRSGGAIANASPAALREDLRRQMAGVTSWPEFLRTPFTLDPAQVVPAARRDALMALPSSVRLLGDALKLYYEIADGEGVVRLHLREGQARRLRPQDVPVFDRPLRFAVVRNHGAPALGDTLAEAIRALKWEDRRERKDDWRARRGGGPKPKGGGGGRFDRKSRPGRRGKRK
jgi:hypothetical protein